MTRDMDLFREILLRVEATPTDHFWTAEPLLGYGVNDVVGHIRLIDDAGLAVARYSSNVSNEDAVILRLTNDGFDFLEASKQETLWDKAKHQVKSAGLPLTVFTLKQALDALIRAHLHL